MDKKKRQLVLSLARKNRAWMQKNRHQYRDGVYGSDLAGACAIASVRLLKLLNLKRVKGVTIIGNDHHCFIMVDEYVLDVTATQFSPFEDKPVLFITMEELIKIFKKRKGQNWRNNFWWEIGTQVSTIKEFLKWQKEVSWNEDQQIKPEHLKKVA